MPIAGIGIARFQADPEKSGAGDLRTIKLLLDPVRKTELAAPPPEVK